jgi:hypothetical protein
VQVRVIFVGQVMKASGGKANPQAVNELLKKKLGVWAASNVIPGLVPGIQPSAGCAPSRALYPGNKCRDDDLTWQPMD